MQDEDAEVQRGERSEFVARIEYAQAKLETEF
jgi:hypothetical protein